MDARLIIDMQVTLAASAHDIEFVVPRTRHPIDHCRAIDVPVIYVQHNHATFAPMKRGEPGWQLLPELGALADDGHIEKEACDAFYGTRLDEHLQAHAADRLIVTGV
jgi:nicotinamidase-related amidase